MQALWRGWCVVAIATTLVALHRDAVRSSGASHPANVRPPVLAGCVADCDQDGHVTVDELIVAVNIALGQLSLDACPAADPDGDGQVTVDELIVGVNAALTGCRRPTATPSNTVTPTDTPRPTPTVEGVCVEPFPLFPLPCPGAVALFNACLGGCGGSQCFNVVAASDCCWTTTVLSNPECSVADVTITAGDRGCGNSTVCFSYGLNTCRHEIREVSIDVGGQLFGTLQVYNTPPPMLSPTGPTPTPTPAATRTPTLGLTLSLTEFPLATAGARPFGITAGPDGNLWFIEFDASRIARISTKSPNLITELPLPTANSGPLGITAGPDGNLWFTEGASNRIGRISPTNPNTITEFSIPTANSSPSGIAAGPDGNLWFTEPGANKIGRISPTGSNAITEFPIPTADSVPNAIVSGPDGNMWFTEYGTAGIGRITPGITNVITEFRARYGLPFGITTGPDDALWFTEVSFYTGTSGIGRIAPTGPSAVSISELLIPSVPLDPSFAITAGPDGNVWFVEAGQIGQVMPNTFPSGIGLSFVASGSEITSGPDGNLWFTDANGNRIVRVALPLTGQLNTRAEAAALRRVAPTVMRR